MRTLTLFQTIENRGDVDTSIQNGPYLCSRSDAWLGEGYYFWDSYIENAHFWGRVAYHKKGKSYLIAQSTIQFEEGELYDLLEPQVKHEFLMAYMQLKKTIHDTKILTVAFMIEYFKLHSDFNFKAIRADNDRRHFYIRNPLRYKQQSIKFNARCEDALDLFPQVQLCILDKDFVGTNNYQLVYNSSEKNQSNVSEQMLA